MTGVVWTSAAIPGPDVHIVLRLQLHSRLPQRGSGLQDSHVQLLII